MCNTAISELLDVSLGVCLSDGCGRIVGVSFQDQRILNVVLFVILCDD